jgi:sugar phosphate isomerase/epimerase
MKFAPIFAALKRNGYDATVAVEPFDYVPDGPGAGRVRRRLPARHSRALA